MKTRSADEPITLAWADVAVSTYNVAPTVDTPIDIEGATSIYVFAKETGASTNQDCNAILSPDGINYDDGTTHIANSVNLAASGVGGFFVTPGAKTMKLRWDNNDGENLAAGTAIVIVTKPHREV
jgi:hypothetical protein